MKLCIFGDEIQKNSLNFSNASNTNTLRHQRYAAPIVSFPQFVTGLMLQDGNGRMQVMQKSVIETFPASKFSMLTEKKHPTVSSESAAQPIAHN